MHTPGPWTVAGPNALSGPGYVMTLGGTYIAKPLINYDDNARLIAAAPEMLAALKELDELRDGCAPDELGAIVGKRIAEFVQMYRAAIAKAESN